MSVFCPKLSYNKYNSNTTTATTSFQHRDCFPQGYEGATEEEQATPFCTDVLPGLPGLHKKAKLSYNRFQIGQNRKNVFEVSKTNATIFTTLKQAKKWTKT